MMTKLAAVLALTLATGCGLETQDQSTAREPDAAPQDAPDRPDGAGLPPDAADAPESPTEAPDATPEAEACVPDPNVCGHTCGSSDGCGHAIDCTTCFGGCSVAVGDGVVCPTAMHEVRCPTGRPTSSVCYLAGRTSASDVWCCPV